MNDMVIAVYEDGDWSFYDNKFVRIMQAGGKKLYTVLPDHYFYFFQTDITAKRNIKKTIRAYAKTIFPEENGFIGYIYNPNGALGYIVSDEIKNIKRAEILKNSVFITTPFLIRYAYLRSSFIYIGKEISAVFDSKKLLCYTKGNYEDIKNRISDTASYKRIDASLTDSLKNLTELVHNHKHKAIGLSIDEKATDFDLRKSLPAIVSAAILVILIISGELFRYGAIKKDLSLYENKINLIYKKAFKDKNYQDPYGMLLYKAKQCEVQSGIKPMNLIYALSKAKKSDTRVDSVIYGKTIKIKGEAANYDSLVSYLNAFNNILHIDAKVENTTNKNGRLKFSLIYSEK